MVPSRPGVSASVPRVPCILGNINAMAPISNNIRVQGHLNCLDVGCKTDICYWKANFVFLKLFFSLFLFVSEVFL